ncbi:NUDIX hydrolase [Streptomyces sp. NPDC051577]|uniref:nucleotide triphosphate diphosphatase NUDT15 n=1 Tax=Streptomyces sp. NPDC051577 TaxID=3155166 RepID=UPI003436840F
MVPDPAEPTGRSTPTTPGAAAPSPEPWVRAAPRPNAVVGVGLVVVDADGRILLGRAHDGRWELPGGKVDPGEGFEQAAARELAEETSLRAQPDGIEVLAVHIDSAAGLTRLTAAAVTHTFEGAPAVTEPDKIARWAWFAPTEIPTDLYVPSVTVLRTCLPEARDLPAVSTYDYATPAHPTTDRSTPGHPTTDRSTLDHPTAERPSRP